MLLGARGTARATTDGPHPTNNTRKRPASPAPQSWVAPRLVKFYFVAMAFHSPAASCLDLVASPDALSPCPASFVRFACPPLQLFPLSPAVASDPRRVGVVRGRRGLPGLGERGGELVVVRQLVDGELAEPGHQVASLLRGGTQRGGTPGRACRTCGCRRPRRSPRPGCCRCRRAACRAPRPAPWRGRHRAWRRRRRQWRANSTRRGLLVVLLVVPPPLSSAPAPSPMTAQPTTTAAMTPTGALRRGASGSYPDCWPAGSWYGGWAANCGCCWNCGAGACGGW